MDIACARHRRARGRRASSAFVDAAPGRVGAMPSTLSLAGHLGRLGAAARADRRRRGDDVARLPRARNRGLAARAARPACASGSRATARSKPGRARARLPVAGYLDAPGRRSSTVARPTAAAPRRRLRRRRQPRPGGRARRATACSARPRRSDRPLHVARRAARATCRSPRASAAAAPASCWSRPASVDGIVQAVVELGFFRRVQPARPRAADARRRDRWRRPSARRRTARRLEELLEETQRQAEELQSAAGRAARHQRGARGAGPRAAASRRRGSRTSRPSSSRPTRSSRSRPQLLERADATTSTRAQATLDEQGRRARARQPLQVASSSPTCRHELRTPLNSSLILAKLLADNQRRQPDRRAGQVRADHLRRPATTC